MPGCRYLNHGRRMSMTNADRIRMMTDEELTKIIMCPYDTFGESVDIMPCIRNGKVQVSVTPQFCYVCMRKWLRAELEEEPKSTIPESVKDFIHRRFMTKQ